MEEGVIAGVLVGVGSGQFVPNDALLQSLERMANADVQVGTSSEAGTNEVGTGHHENIGGLDWARTGKEQSARINARKIFTSVCTSLFLDFDQLRHSPWFHHLPSP